MALKFIFGAIVFFFVCLFSVSVVQAAKLSGASANPDKIWFYNTTLYSDFTSSAIDTTVSDVTLVSVLNSVHYVGMDYVFDKIVYNVGVAGTLGAVTWEYWNGSSWTALSGVTDGTNGFLNSGTNNVAFSIPSDWATTTVNSVSKYYVRARATTLYGVIALATQVSAREYNLKVKAQDELGNNLTGLTSSSFSVSAGTDNTVYALSEIGSGVYEMSLDTTEADTNFNITVSKDGYVTSNATSTGTLTTQLTNKSGNPLLLPLAYKVTVKTENNNNLSGATVTAGNSFSVSCAETGSSAVYYCSIPEAHTGLTIKVEKTAFVTNTSNVFSTDRTIGTDAQVTLTITNIQYAAITNFTSGSTGQTAIALSWTASNDSNFDQYELYYKLSSDISYSNGTAWTKVNDANLDAVSTNATTITGLQDYTTYYFVIYALDLNGNRSVISSVLSAATKIQTAGSGVEDDRGITSSFHAPVTTTASDTPLLLTATLATITASATPATATTSPSVTLVSKTTASSLLKSDLDFGQRGEDIKKLQQFLASDHSLYPQGLITGYFGPLTQKAVQRFQERYGIIKSGTPQTTGYGRVGRVTRAMLLEVFGSELSPSPVVEKELQRLQQELRLLEEKIRFLRQQRSLLWETAPL